MVEQQPSTRMGGAFGRAAAVALVVMMPALLVAGLAPETGQILILLSLFAGAAVFVEYVSAYPALVEFRFAQPYNRSRFALIALMVLMLSLLQRGIDASGPLTDLVAVIAAGCGRLMDLPFSPVRLLLAALPDSLPAATVELVRDGASLALVLSLATMAGFFAALRLNVWPMGNGPFNVWINLPTFDPTAGNDVVQRLQRQANINIVLGILAPFLLPVMVWGSGLMIRPVTFTSTIGFVWGIAAWGFLPATLVMRGLAMARVARMIRANRRRFADSEGNAYAAA